MVMVLMKPLSVSSKCPVSLRDRDFMNQTARGQELTSNSARSWGPCFSPSVHFLYLSASLCPFRHSMGGGQLSQTTVFLSNPSRKRSSQVAQTTPSCPCSGSGKGKKDSSCKKLTYKRRVVHTWGQGYILCL